MNTNIANNFRRFVAGYFSYDDDDRYRRFPFSRNEREVRYHNTTGRIKIKENLVDIDIYCRALTVLPLLEAAHSTQHTSQRKVN